MGSEETVLNPFVVITPKNKLSAYRIWATLPPYRLRSIFECKPVFLKKENIKSAEISNSVWTFFVSNDDYDEIIIRAEKDEVQGGFVQNGPSATKWYSLIRKYIFYSPSLITFLLIFVSFAIGKFLGDHFKSEEFLKDYPYYQSYPKEFLAIIKTRLILWTVLIPSTLAPIVVALFTLSGFWKSRIGRIQASIKVEAWMFLAIGIIASYNVPLFKLIKHTDILFAPLNSPKIEKVILDQRAEKNK